MYKAAGADQLEMKLMESRRPLLHEGVKTSNTVCAAHKLIDLRKLLPQ